MSGKKIRLQIITPSHIKVDEDIDMAIMRCTTGDWGVLSGHEVRSVVLDYGIIRILDSENERWIAVYGGLAMVRKNVLTVLTPEAEWPEDIDLARANADREEMQQRLREKTDDRELQKDEILLRRALVQIEVASSSLTAQE